MQFPELVNLIEDDFKNSLKHLESISNLEELNNLMKLQTKISILTVSTAIEQRLMILLKELLNPLKREETSIFIYKQALERKFHTLFNFKENHLNYFFGLFGIPMKEFLKKKAELDEEFKKSTSSIMTLLSKRNLLAHEIFYLTSIDLTMTEVLELSESAEIFFSKFPVYFTEFYSSAIA
jgi:hypothetical protein